MAIKPTTGIETHPVGTTGLNGILNGNWDRLEAIFAPLAITPPAGAVMGWDAALKKFRYGATLTGAYERHVQLAAKLDGTGINQPTPIDFGTVGGLQFPSTGAKNAFCQFEVPDDWDGTTDMVFEIDWFPDSGAMSGTDTVEWQVEYRSITEGESNQLGTARLLTVTDSSDYAQYVTKHARFTLARLDANQPLVKQDHVYLRITRNTAVANDFAGTVTISGFEWMYNSVGFPTT